MKYSGIGGQVVMEGVMMKNKDFYAVAVRKSDGEIVVDKKKVKTQAAVEAVQKIPIVRGVVNFVDSLYLGIGSLMYSSTFFEEEEEDRKKKEEDPETAKKKEHAMMGTTLFISLLAAILIFMVLPYYLSTIFSKWISSGIVLALIEGVIRLLIFFGYILAISRMKDIQRVFMYHGAEHKCINCIEHGLDLNVENVRKSTRLHKRCGTSFLLFVVLVSIVLFAFIQVDSRALRILLRLVLIPVVAGIAYELIRLAGRSDNPVVNLLSKPGLAMQHLTTKEPDDSMIEVGIASVEAVFDWRPYVREVRGEKADAPAPETPAEEAAAGEAADASVKETEGGMNGEEPV